MPKCSQYICNKDFYTKSNLDGHKKYCKLIKKYKRKKNKLKHTKKILKSLESSLFKHELRKATDKIQSKQNKTFADSINEAKLTMFARNIGDILDGKKPSPFKYPMGLKSSRKKYKRKKYKRKKSTRKKSKHKKYRRRKSRK